jgi:hypothetical protein
MFKIFGPNPICLPGLALVCSALTLYALYFLGRKIYDEMTAWAATLIFATTEFFLFFSRSGLSESVFLLFFWSAFGFFVVGLGSGRTRDFLWSGICVALALYTKYSAPVLLLIFAVIGGLHWRNINRNWFLLSIVLPAAAFAPYVLVFIRYVTPSVIAERHLSTIGLNHLCYLYYLFAFAPAALILAALYSVRIRKTDYYLAIAFLIFFVVLGFYRPYFRLAYPLVPMLAFMAGRFVAAAGKWKPYLLGFVVLASAVLGWKTAVYRSFRPVEIAAETNRLMHDENVGYGLAVIPPNVLFYLPGRLALPEDHPAVRLARRLPPRLQARLGFDDWLITRPEQNRLTGQDHTVLLYSTVMDPFKSEHEGLLNRGHHLKTWEFIDAPVYYRDIFNPLRNRKQLYELYLFDHKEMSEDLNQLWDLAFQPECQVIGPTR